MYVSGSGSGSNRSGRSSRSNNSSNISSTFTFDDSGAAEGSSRGVSETAALAECDGTSRTSRETGSGCVYLQVFAFCCGARAALGILDGGRRPDERGVANLLAGRCDEGDFISISDARPCVPRVDTARKEVSSAHVCVIVFVCVHEGAVCVSCQIPAGVASRTITRACARKLGAVPGTHTNTQTHTHITHRRT